MTHPLRTATVARKTGETEIELTINLDGTGRTTLLDVESSPFSNINDWHGFAVDPIPEPMTLALAGVGLAGLGGDVRRRRRV